MSRWVRWGSIPVVAAIVVAGIWVTGAVITDDFAVARVLTGAFLTVGAAAAVLVSWRWRPLAVPVLATFAVVAGGLSGWLLLSSTRTITVQEDVAAIVTPPPTPDTAGQEAGEPPAPAGPVAQSRGEFVGVAHETSGTADLIRRPDGSLAVRLTDLATDPGPDLRVYAVPGDGRSAKGASDLGRLRGNVGTQEYALPDDLDPKDVGAVVIWCRAFSVNFGYATLTAV